MIELVIPTLYKSPNLQKMLPKYLEYDLVTDIHIIDNGQGWIHNYPWLLGHTKIKVYTPQKYNEWMINPAWNLGVSRCKQNSIVGILNDDIVFPTDVFEYIAYFSEDMGILGMHDTNYKCTEKAYEIVDIPQHCYGWGCAIFMEKRDWIPIPDELKLYYGDSWLFHEVPVKCRALKGLPMSESNISATNAHPEFIKEFTEQYKKEQVWFSENARKDLNWGGDSELPSIQKL